MQWCWLKGVLCLLLACQVYAQVQTQVYPSTGTAWVLPGWWEEPLATSYFNSALEVKKWEFRHADIVFGSLQDVNFNRQTIAVGYIYTQKLDCRPGNQSAWLSRQAHSAGIDMEEGFLHFAEDTRLAVEQPSTGLGYLLQGQPYHLLLVRNGRYSTARLPLTVRPDDEIILFSSYPLDTLELKAPSSPKLLVNTTNEQGNVAGWQEPEVHWEQSKAGEVLGQPEADNLLPINLVGQLIPPTSWPSAFASFQGRQLNSGEAGLNSGLRTWMVKLAWPEGARLDAVSIRPWLKLDNGELMIPGWDAANDSDGDGYVSDPEFSRRKNTAASARFRHQARLIPAGHMWPGTCWYRVNFLHPEFNNLHASWYRYDWRRQGLSGAYNDDMAKLLGENQFTVLSGGKIAEMPYRAGSEDAATEYALQLARFLQQVKEATQTHWLAANISELNLWHYSVWPEQLREVVDLWLREHYLSPAMGLKRMQRAWDSFALAKAGDKSLIMAAAKGGRSGLVPSSAESWQRDIETGLALYYFFNLPGYTYYHSWNQTYIYGSGNTSLRNWYREGVPKNWVYQPTAMLNIDIGSPESPPRGHKIVKWQNKGDKAKSTESEISGIPLHPANWFWLYRSGWFEDQPAEGVMARQYSDGLVVYRAVKERNNNSFLLAKPLRVSLPGKYQRLHYDGSLGEAISYIELGGYEGAVLKKVEE